MGTPSIMVQCMILPFQLADGPQDDDVDNVEENTDVLCGIA